MKVAILLLLVTLCGCTVRNMLPGNADAYCRSEMAGLVPWHKNEADRELQQKSPNGWANQPYSRENWDKYWNNIVFHVGKVDKHSCAGAYDGPSGEDMVREILAYRARIGLPQVNWDERNIGKGL